MSSQLIKAMDSEAKLSTTFSYQCPFCKDRFCQKENLNQHLQTIHKSGKNTCQYCGKDFYQKHYLTRHIQITHEHDDHQVFQCDQCEKQFEKISLKFISKQYMKEWYFVVNIVEKIFFRNTI